MERSHIREDFNTLVLGPGGNKGIVELGALEYYRMIGELNNLSIISGVSVGSVIGLLLATGYTPEEILTEALSTNLLDIDNLLPYEEIANQYGLFSQKSFKTKMESMVRNKFGAVLNLEQLWHATGKEFMAVTTNIKVDKDNPVQVPYYLNYKTEPYLSCVNAALMSSNIPALFSKIEYKSGIYVDGALSNPYPVDQYDVEGNKILGISVIGIPESGGSKLFDYFVQAIHAPISQLRSRIQSNASNRVTSLNIQVPISSSMNLTPSKEAKYDMFMIGFKAAKKFHKRPSEPVYPRETDEVPFD